MDLQNLRAKYPLLINYLKENNYVKAYIQRFSNVTDYILREEGINNWGSYTHIYLTCTRITKSSSSLRAKRNIIGAIERFDLKGIYPCRFQRNRILKKNSYDFLSVAFKEIIDVYLEVEKIGKKKASSIYSESHNVTAFLLSLQSKGIDSMATVTEDAVLQFFFQNGTLCKGYSYKRVISSVFKICAPYFPVNTFTRVLSFLPALREVRKNIQYLTEEEVSKIKVILNGYKIETSYFVKGSTIITKY